MEVGCILQFERVAAFEPINRQGSIPMWGLQASAATRERLTALFSGIAEVDDGSRFWESTEIRNLLHIRPSWPKVIRP
jgi:hypothetical protein